MGNLSLISKKLDPANIQSVDAVARYVMEPSLCLHYDEEECGPLEGWSHNGHHLCSLC